MDAADIDTFADQVFNAILGAQQVQAAWLGIKLGWYRALADQGPLTTSQLADLTRSSERYAREWCEHQTVSGWITCKDASVAKEQRQYYLTAAQQAVLCDADSLTFLAPLCKLQGSLGRNLDGLKDAYQNDTGVSWGDFGDDDARESVAEGNRPMFLQQLGQDYLSSIPEVHAALQAGGRVADVGAGFGWSSIGVATAYPLCKVDAFDLDQESVQRAKLNIASAGLTDRVTAQCVDVGDQNFEATPYDLVMALECIHDMGDPVAVLASMKKLAGDTGSVVVMDERAQEEFTGDTENDIEKLLYGFSLTCCLADCKSHPNSAATGSVMRPSQLEWYAIEAGFRGLEILPIEHDFFRFYKLKK